MDKPTITLILNNNKKSRCCLDELIQPTIDGIAVRADNRKEREMNGLVKPMDEKPIKELDDLFHAANDALLKVQKFIDKY